MKDKERQVYRARLSSSFCSDGPESPVRQRQSEISNVAIAAKYFSENKVAAETLVDLAPKASQPIAVKDLRAVDHHAMRYANGANKIVGQRIALRLRRSAAGIASSLRKRGLDQRHRIGAGRHDRLQARAH